LAHTGQIAPLQPYAKRGDVYRTRQQEDVFESEYGAPGLLALNRIDAKSDEADWCLR
jgi:hypothetical protein